jgi:hypothetical protein
MTKEMDAYKLCSADKDLNPKTCKFSLKCKPGMERDEKFLCKKSANVGKAKESLQQRLNSYLKTGQNKTLGINIRQLKKKLTGKNGQGISNSLNRMLEQIREHQEKNPSKRTQKKKPKTETRMVVREPSRNSSIYYGLGSRSRSGSRSTLNSPMHRQNSIGSINGSAKGYNQHLAERRKPAAKFQNKYGVPLGQKI